MGKARFGPWRENHFETREDLPPMETNEIAIQYQAAEKELIKLIEAVEGVEEGEFKQLEETIYQGIFKVGRQLMECAMNKENTSKPVPTKIQGECRHDQKLVGYRKKKLLTMFGEVEFKRAYYQCQIDKER